MPYTLQYKGTCNSTSGAYNCTGKATSEGIDTVIKAHGNPDSKVNKKVGSLSVWTSTGTENDSGDITESGSFTFGVHSNHESHSFTYISKGNEEFATSCQSAAGAITGGKGTLQGASGRLTWACCTDADDDTKFDCWVSGYIIVPDSN